MPVSKTLICCLFCLKITLFNAKYGTKYLHVEYIAIGITWFARAFFEFCDGCELARLAYIYQGYFIGIGKKDTMCHFSGYECHSTVDILHQFRLCNWLSEWYLVQWIIHLPSKWVFILQNNETTYHSECHIAGMFYFVFIKWQSYSRMRSLQLF